MMSYKVAPDMLGETATEAQARRMVELLAAKGYDVEYVAALSRPNRSDEEPSEQDWEAALDIIAAEEQPAPQPTPTQPLPLHLQIKYRDVEIDTAPFVAKRGHEPTGSDAYVFQVGDEEYVCLDWYVRCRNVAAKYAAERGIAKITLMPFEN